MKIYLPGKVIMVQKKYNLTPLHFVTKDFIVSHVYNYTNKNNVTMMPIGFRVDGTKMSEMEVDSITSIVNYDTRVDFSNGINIDTANRVQVVNSNHLFEQSKLSSMKR